MKPLRVDSARWTQRFAQWQADGLVWFDFLTAIDRGDHVDVVAAVADPAHRQAGLAVTAVVDEVSSLTSLFPGASWYERETQEMFGIGFIGLADARPLIYRTFLQPPPLRKARTT